MAIRPRSPLKATLALAGVAANIGGIEPILAERPGSWEPTESANRS